MTDTPARHGTRAEYIKRGCRCDDCREATRLYDRERREKNANVRVQALEAGRRYAAKHPQRRRATTAQWRAKNPEKVAEQSRLRAERFRLKRYAVTREQHAELMKKQEGKCAICRSTDTRSLSIDHDHNTGAIRGLLCRRCNMGLGCFGDNPTSLNAAAQYLYGSIVAPTV